MPAEDRALVPGLDDRSQRELIEAASLCQESLHGAFSLVRLGRNAAIGAAGAAWLAWVGLVPPAYLAIIAGGAAIGVGVELYRAWRTWDAATSVYTHRRS